MAWGIKRTLAGAVVAAAMASASAAMAQDAAAGAVYFKQRCQTCHAIAEGEPSRMGPNLFGIVGDEAASREFKYSPALSEAGLVWDLETLDGFLKSPMATVRGTRMLVATPNDEKRANLIAFLETLKPEE